uniref:Transposase n=1 Tax=Pyxidicoccus sp. MCy9557 TaxID=2012863 RepID=A0A1Z2TJK9_9BACT|nr:transposase [Pyxidicoccus sp. MCy9557]
MEMEKELEQFRQEAQRLKAGRRSGSLPFPEALRAFAVRYAEHTVATGGTVTDAAQKLGVSGPTLYEWRKGRPAGRPRPKPAEKSAALVPVHVGERPAQAAGAGLQQVALVSPSGWRVEGLSVEAAAQLLGRLGC